MAETLAATARKVQLVPEKPRHGDELFAELFGALYAESVRLAALFGADDPEDIAQEAFARLHARLGRLSEADAPAYLRAIVCNLSRSRGRRLSVARRPHPLVPAAPPEPDPGDVVAARGDRDRIRTATRTFRSGSARLWSCTSGRDSPTRRPRRRWESRSAASRCICRAPSRRSRRR